MTTLLKLLEACDSDSSACLVAWHLEMKQHDKTTSNKYKVKNDA